MIPMHPDLEDHHLDYVIKTINQFYRN